MGYNVDSRQYFGFRSWLAINQRQPDNEALQNNNELFFTFLSLQMYFCY